MADDFELEWHGDAIAEAVLTASMDGLELAAEHLLTVSSQLAPHEEGDLERSGETSYDPAQQAAAVSYDRPYAVRQHEETSWRHDAGKTAKYLEHPMNEERDTMLQLLAAPMQKKMG